MCHLFQALSSFSGTGSSHVKLCSHNRWSRIFMRIIVGEHHPRTSNKRAMLDTSTRFVKGSLTSREEITGRKQSDTMFHSMPKTLVYSSWWWISCLVFRSFRFSGMLASTSLSLDFHFRKLKPPSSKSCCNSSQLNGSTN